MDALTHAVVAVAPIKDCFTPSCFAKDAANSMIQELVKAFGKACIAMLRFLSTFWMQVPSPTVATENGGWHTVSTISQLQGWLGPFTALIAIGSFSVAVGRVGITGRGEDARKVVRQLAAVAAGTLVITAVTQLLIEAGDQFSPWIISRAAGGGDPSKGMDTLISTGFGSGVPTQNIGLWLIVFILAILGAIAQCIFMIVRGATLMVLMVFVAPVAAGAATDEGWARFKRFGMLIIGFALYKPVAAIIYATGIMLMSKPAGGSAGGTGDVKNALYGLTIMVLAALALPAFIKFLMPIAAMGSSSMFSGAAVAGVVAAGAAIVATGGAGAAAGGASAGGAGAAGTAGTSGKAGGTGAGQAGPSGGGGPGGPPGGSGTGSPGLSGADGAPSPGGTDNTTSGGPQFAHAMAGGTRDASSGINSAEVEDQE